MTKRKNLIGARFVRKGISTFFVLCILLMSTSSTIASDQPPIMKNPLVVKQLRQNMMMQVAEWAMPVVSFFANKEALQNDFDVEIGTVVYWSKPFGAEVKLLTPNDTSLYFTTQLELFDGPVTLVIPTIHESGLNFFGTIMNAWQTPIEDVGPKGFDKGKGGKYFITPPDYSGKVPDDVIHCPSTTYNVVAGFRVTPKTFSVQDLKAAAEYGKTMRIYSKSIKETNFFDAYGKQHNPLPPYDGKFFRILQDAINTEPAFEYDARFYTTLQQFGIKKGGTFKHLPIMDAALTAMRHDLRDYFRRDMGFWMFPNAHWQLPVDLTVEAGSQFTYLMDSEYHWYRRAMTFHWAVWAPKYLGEATFYTIAQFDKDGKNLDSNKTYKLTVPAKVPAGQFWSATVYSMDTFAFYDDVHTVAINSLQEDLLANEDGSTDVYFGPSLPKAANKGNWVPTRAGNDFFVLFRWYGPQPELFNGKWSMGDLEKQE